MNQEQYPSKLLSNAVEQFASLPGIGRKTALRLVLHLLRQEKELVNDFGNAIIQLHNEIKYCKICKNISDTEICSICSKKTRDKNTICVVENIRDVISVENTGQYNGLYHVLGGIISPMDGIGPGDLTISDLIARIKPEDIKEVIIALSTTMEGDTTAFYMYKKLKDFGIKISTIARGISIGDELEYADEITLGKSIQNRTLFEDGIKNE